MRSSGVDMKFIGGQTANRRNTGDKVISFGVWPRAELKTQLYSNSTYFRFDSLLESGYYFILYS
jgi:hypothetical protein